LSDPDPTPPDAIAWDAHAHVIGDSREYPFSPQRSYTPQPASLDEYLAILDRYGIERGVLVQPSVYGHDHRCLLHALKRASGRLRGIAVPSPDATTQDLESMHERGVRGVRCNLINPGGLSPAAVVAWQPALRAMEWHVELHVPVDRLAGWADVIQSFDVPVVVDHMGRPTAGAVDPKSPALAQLIRFVREGRCFVKLSAPYRLAPGVTPRGSERSEPRSVTSSGGVGPPAVERWKTVTPLARVFLEANASACLWGTDWPHVDTAPAVDTRDVVAALDDWRGDRWTRRQITGDAAGRLFA
jgi:predicted TIM-barrel fold metal-dependent hydrolase